MPTKDLSSPADRNGDQKLFKFGGGANTIFALDHDASFGYWIDGGGGNDTITGADFQIDSETGEIIGFSDDVILGGDGSDILAGGLGNDRIFGGNELGEDGAKGRNASVENFLYGDARFSSFGGSYTGGNDVLHGSNNATNNLLGDVASVNATTFQGGKDKLVGGTDGANFMVGDASSGGFGGTLTGGADTLISGKNSDDTMWGDFVLDQMSTKVVSLTGGADTFVFGSENGQDTIKDFEAGKDKINLASATGVTLATLNNVAGEFIDAADQFVTVDASDNLVIDLGAAAGGHPDLHLLTIENVTQLAVADVDFSTIINSEDFLV